MYKFTVIVFALALVSCVKTSSNSACSQNITTSNCIDLNTIDSNSVCTTEYDPVCGCNEVTYGNECNAAQAGVQSWVQGECCP